MTSLLYPFVNLNAEFSLTQQLLTNQRLSGSVNLKWQILLSYTEERINGLRVIDRLNSFHTILLRSGLNLFGLEMELIEQEDNSIELQSNEFFQIWQLNDMAGIDAILPEIERVKQVLTQCNQEKLISKDEVSILYCGLHLLSIVLEKIKVAQCH